MDRNELMNFLNELEGFSSGSYFDSRGIATVGHGLNLDDANVRNKLILRGYDPELIRSRQQAISEEDSRAIKNEILDIKENEIRGVYKDNHYPSDSFNDLKPHQKAALLSVGYNSINPIKNNINNIIKGDDIGVIQGLLKGSKDPGILKRRLREAELYSGDPVTFSGAFKAMQPDERKSHLDMLNKIENEHERKKVLEKYQSYLEEPKQTYPTLDRLFAPEKNPIPLKIK